MKFTEVLEEYLQERDRQNSDFYDNRFIGYRVQGRERMDELTEQMDQMVEAKLKEKNT